ncbi:hypothetical protein F5B18DRAFT_649102 [Nemania serpens]|nr:hypothetical protein F5B18DRAFT_649102 [Nemania serpens]
MDQPTPTNIVTPTTPHATNTIPAVYIVAIIAAVSWAILLLIVIVQCTGRCRKRKADPERGEGNAKHNNDQAEETHQARQGPAIPESVIQNGGEFEEISLSEGAGTAQAIPLKRLAPKPEPQGGVSATRPQNPPQDPNDPNFYELERTATTDTSTSHVAYEEGVAKLAQRARAVEVNAKAIASPKEIQWGSLAGSGPDLGRRHESRRSALFASSR